MAWHLIWRLILLLLLHAAAVAAPQTTPPPGLTLAGQAIVTDVVDGDTVILDDGRQVRLVGIQAPKLPLGRSDFTPWPLAAEARDALAGLVAGRQVMLMTGGANMDRHGRVLAHLVRSDDKLWVQGELLSRGLARVYTFADNRTGAAAMLALEAAARTKQAGIWNGDPFYALRDRHSVKGATNRFEIVEDVVLEVAEVRGTVYLNFEPDWRRDFTVKIKPATRRIFDRGTLDLSQLAGSRIRVRGWVRWENGPMIVLTHPEQLEVLPGTVGKSGPGP